MSHPLVLCYSVSVSLHCGFLLTCRVYVLSGCGSPSLFKAGWAGATADRAEIHPGLYPPVEKKGDVIKMGIFVEHGAESPEGLKSSLWGFCHCREKLEWSCRSENLPTLWWGPLTFCGSDIQESENIASLHNQITACDAVLEVSHHDLWLLITVNQIMASLVIL